MSARLTAADIATAVRRRYGCETDDLGPEWAALDEMDLQPGFSTRRIDLLLIRAWRSAPRRHERHAVEIKVSRADLQRELDDPHKWRAWHAVTHRFYLAVPASLDLDGLELPDEWGIITVTSNGTRELREAPHHTADELPEPVVVEAFRRAARAEARIRTAAAEDDLPARLAQLTRDVAAAERAKHTARAAERRWKTRAKDVIHILAHITPDMTCERCGEPITTERLTAWSGNSYRGWTHVDATNDTGGTDECTWATPDLDDLAARLDEPDGN